MSNRPRRATKSTTRKVQRRWYYDACVLSGNLKVQQQIVNSNPANKIKAITSHLAIGEALGSIVYKKKEPVDAFINLITTYHRTGYLTIMGNDKLEKYLALIKKQSFELDLTDAIHLAAALKKKCERLISSDKHFDYSKAKYHDLGNRCGIKNFCFEKVKFQ